MPLKEVFSTNMIFQIFHLFSSPLDTFVIAGEISKSRVFSTHLVYQQGNESPSPAIARCACGQVSREKWKNARAREIKASRSFARANDRVCHDFNLLFFSLSLFPLFFPFFLLLCVYIYRQICAQCVPCVTYGSFHFLSSGWPCIHCTTSYALVERIFNKRLNSFMVYL